MPTAYPRHSITETPALAEVLVPLRQRMGAETPSLAELVERGARATLHELDARDRSREMALSTFVDRLRQIGQPELREFQEIRHSTRQP